MSEGTQPLSEAFLFGRLANNVSEAPVLDIRRCRLASLGGIERCSGLTHVFVGENELRSLAGLDACRELWTLDASNNALRDVSALATFGALGHVCLEVGAVGGWGEHSHGIYVYGARALKSSASLTACGAGQRPALGGPHSAA